MNKDLGQLIKLPLPILAGVALAAPVFCGMPTIQPADISYLLYALAVALAGAAGYHILGGFDDGQKPQGGAAA